MIDEPKTGDKSDKAEIEKSSPSLISSALAGDSPTTTSQTQTESSDKKSKYAEYIVGSFITLWRLCRRGFLLADKHSGGISALRRGLIGRREIDRMPHDKLQRSLRELAGPPACWTKRNPARQPAHFIPPSRLACRVVRGRKVRTCSASAGKWRSTASWRAFFQEDRRQPIHGC